MGFGKKWHKMGADSHPRRISIILYLVVFVNPVTQDIVFFVEIRHNIQFTHLLIVCLAQKVTKRSKTFPFPSH